MNIQLQEIKSLYIKNRLTEGVDFVRKEWLKADIQNGKTMIRLPINSKNFEFKRNMIQIANSGYFHTFGSNTTYGYYITDIDGDTWARHPQIWDRARNDNTFQSSVNVGLGIHTIIADDNGVTISSATNTASLPWYGEPDFISFDNAVNIKKTIHLTSSIKVDGVTRYVPCKLLQPIPAALDANNRARSAGECGMYDSISGKFFGNVASSGTFTVEGDITPETYTGLQQIYQNKLIEGVDYETYDWLKGSVPLGTLMMSLPINSSNCNFTYIWGNSLGNMNVFSTNGFHYYNGNNKSTNTLVVYDLATARNIYYKYNITQPTTVNASDDALMINNSIYPKYGFPITFIHFENVANGTSEGVKILSSISVDGVTRYVPCKLLRSIPRNLDAQCKERVAGECGMIDLISGKFYGNVASSGTFTVENDNNK